MQIEFWQIGLIFFSRVALTFVFFLSFCCFYSWHNVLVNPFSDIPQVYFEINYHHSKLFLVIDSMFVVLAVTIVFQPISSLVIIRYTERASIILGWFIIIPRFILDYWSHSFLTFVLIQYFKWCHNAWHNRLSSLIYLQ